MSTEMEVTDTRGRKIVLRKMSAVERFRFKKLVPAGIGDVTLWFGEAFMAASVKSIDGSPIPTPQDEKGIELIIGMLDDDGMVAVQDGFVKMMSSAALSPEDMEAAKN